jgi:hypothetical protein
MRKNDEQARQFFVMALFRLPFYLGIIREKRKSMVVGVYNGAVDWKMFCPMYV